MYIYFFSEKFDYLESLEYDERHELGHCLNSANGIQETEKSSLGVARNHVLCFAMCRMRRTEARGGPGTACQFDEEEHTCHYFSSEVKRGNGEASAHCNIYLSEAQTRAKCRVPIWADPGGPILAFFIQPPQMTGSQTCLNTRKQLCNS